MISKEYNETTMRWREVQELRRHRMQASVLLLALCATFGHLLAAQPAAAAIPPPQAGREAATVLALLRHSHGLCSEVGTRLLTYWRGPRGQDALDNYVLNQATSEISEARSAADFVRRFLPQARRETDAETAAALERLYELETSLCNTVASPRPPREEFEAGLQEILERIESKEGELGRLLVATEEEVQKALEPYLEPLERAGVEAEREHQAYLESTRAKPSPPTLKELMTAWHQRYAQGAQPTKLALSKYLRARQEHDARAIGVACREMLVAVLPLLDNREFLQAPDSRVETSLRGAYREIQRWAGHCASGRFTEVEKHYERMQQHLTKATALLAGYELRP
ncbi:MAG: hypothetical protein GY856_08135 [bacterium]|nr:hypothetical protein [bacterium]